MPPGVSDDEVATTVRAVLSRHDQLRARFAIRQGRLAYEVPTLDSAQWPFAVKRTSREGLSDLVLALTNESLDVVGGPTHRATIVSAGGTDRRLHLLVHHAVADGISLTTLSGELRTALKEGLETSERVAGRWTYAEFVAWERVHVSRSEAVASTYWSTALEGLARASRFRETTDDESSPEPATITARLSERASEELRARARAVSTTPFVLWLAAVQNAQPVLHSADRRASVVATGVAVDRRPRTMRGRVGMFATEVPVVAEVRSRRELSMRRTILQASRLREVRAYPATLAVAKFAAARRYASLRPEVTLSFVRVPRGASTVIPNCCRPVQIVVYDTAWGFIVRICFDATICDGLSATRFLGELLEVVEGNLRR